MHSLALDIIGDKKWDQHTFLKEHALLLHVPQGKSYEICSRGDRKHKVMLDAKKEREGIYIGRGCSGISRRNVGAAWSSKDWVLGARPLDL
jgi:hypothetical protein